MVVGGADTQIVGARQGYTRWVGSLTRSVSANVSAAFLWTGERALSQDRGGGVGACDADAHRWREVVCRYRATANPRSTVRRQVLRFDRAPHVPSDHSNCSQGSDGPPRSGRTWRRSEISTQPGPAMHTTRSQIAPKATDNAIIQQGCVHCHGRLCASVMQAGPNRRAMAAGRWPPGRTAGRWPPGRTAGRWPPGDGHRAMAVGRWAAGPNRRAMGRRAMGRRVERRVERRVDGPWGADQR